MRAASFNIHLTGPAGGSLTVRFEDAAERLLAIERLDLEPDGYFVWMINAQCGLQVSGMLYDDGRCLQFVHLRGNCLRQHFRQILEQLGEQDAALGVSSLDEARWQDLHTFQQRTWPEEPA